MFEPNPVVEAHKAFDDMIAERRKTRCVNLYESICICEHIISPLHPRSTHDSIIARAGF